MPAYVPPVYVPLWCKSHYSFLEGASTPEELVDAAAALELPAIALTDRDGVYGIVKAHVRAKELGIPLIIGSEVTLEDGSTLVLLVEHATGYRNLCQLITLGRRRMPKGASQVHWSEVYSHAEGLIALWGGRRSSLVGTDDPTRVALALSAAFGDRLYAVVARHRQAEEVPEEARLLWRAKQYAIPTVAGIEVLYHHPTRRPLQDVLTCIQHGVPLSASGRRLQPNAEHGMLSSSAFAALFGDRPGDVARAGEIAGRCCFSLDQLRYRYPSEQLPSGMTSSEWLRSLAYEGARQRYDETVPPDVHQQLDKELSIIRQLEYDGYFLTMWEIVRYCRSHEILCQGRGSAANSVVCYCLGITAIDPVRMELLFERFISVERAEPPDIDLDIEHARREEVIQHVYEKYGRSRAAMVANVVRYRSKSAVRDVGKVLGISETALDRLAKQLGHHESIDEATLAASGIDATRDPWRQLLELSTQILDFPRHLSIHPGGFLLGHEPVCDLVPIENASMAERTVIQWDKDDVEALGLFKVDLLGLGALTQLHLGFDLLRAYYGRALCMATIPPQDEATFAMIRRSDTVGVFQIESRAQMAMLPRLKPRCFYDLVVEVSIVRPGPITGGMIHPYLRRRNGEEPIEYSHPCLEPVLRKTLGIPLFQEQVMRLAVVAADYTPGEADQLRRDMAAWRRGGRLEKHREKLIARMHRKGIATEFAERVFEQILGFGEYGFPESHAASFALISYATSWLRCHYLDIFTCALLNAQPMGFYSPATIVEDARRHGLTILPIDINHSHWDCTLEAHEASGAPSSSRVRYALRMGLRYVHRLTRSAAQRIIDAPRPFATLEAFVLRTQLDAGALGTLAEAGAFASLGLKRRHALWKALGLAHSPPTPLETQAPRQAPPLPPLDRGEAIRWDYQTSQHSTLGHPLGMLRKELRARRIPDARGLASLRDGQRTDYVGAVICRQRPGTASGVLFMTLEDETGFANLVVWKDVFERYALIAKTETLLGVTGRLQIQGSVVHLVAESLWVPTFSKEPAKLASRDFR